jgi:glycosyltransferase involved in cell wall biosynthesis
MLQPVPAAHSGLPLVSIVTPAYNEAESLVPLYLRLCAVFGALDVEWEWVVIDDHSSDITFDLLENMAQRDPRIRALRFARNSGSHLAVTCGLREAAGACAVIIAADLQDPPETLPDLIAHWRKGAQVVWAARAARHGENISTTGFARLYYWLMRSFVGLKQMPVTGADFFLLDRCVLDSFREFQESNASIMTLILWMGFRQDSITYEKQARVHGSSKWNLESKLKLVVDSITAFTYKPIRCMSYAGFVVALVGFLYALDVVFNALAGHPVPGWTSLMVVVLVLGGFQMIMMGVLGEYLWRALDETRRRPRYLIEAAIGQTRGRAERAMEHVLEHTKI